MLRFKMVNYRKIKNLLFISIFLFSGLLIQAQEKPPVNRMDYHLSWDGKSTILKIDLLYHANAQDSTVFIYGNPGAGGQPRIFDILGNVKTGAGDSLVIAAKDRKLTVFHDSEGIKKLHVEIDGKLVPGPERVRPNEAFRPTLAPGFLYTLGFQLFMDVADSAYNQIGIVWDSWPQDMPYLVSTDPEAKPDEMQVIAADSKQKNTFMLQMNENLSIKKYNIKGVTNYLLTSKSDSTSGLPEDIKSMLTGFVPLVRDFWQDHTAPFYLLSVIPFQNKVPSTMTGMGLLEGLSVRYSGPLDMEKTQLIAHEISHHWIGVKLQYQSVGMENNWFNEGFNDYIAVYNLARAGLFNKKDFSNYMNAGNLQPHYTSPIAAIPGDSIEANFFKSSQYEKIPYHRGLIYAFYLDNKIRLATAGKQNIKHFLMALYSQNKKDNGRPITVTEFTKAISAFLPAADVAAEINTYMLEGKLIDFRKVKLIDEFLISYAEGVPVLSLSANADLKKIYN